MIGTNGIKVSRAVEQGNRDDNHAMRNEIVAKNILFFIYRTTTMFGFDVIVLENQFVNLKNVKVAKLWLIFLFIFVFNFAK